MGVVMEGGSGGQDSGVSEGFVSKVALLRKDQAVHTYRELCILECVNIKIFCLCVHLLVSKNSSVNSLSEMLI